MDFSDLIVGVEGGGTKTNVYVVNLKGKVIAKVEGSSSNLWNIGFDKCCEVLYELITEAKQKAGISPDEPFRVVGLSLSGLETKEIKEKLKTALLTKYPHLSKDYYVDSDTRAPLAMVDEINQGGVVLICGTGSNCLLINPDQKEVQCGGFGDRLSDEASAYWIAYKCIKICLDDLFNLEKPPCNYSTKPAWEAIKKHFDIEDTHGLISVFYQHFNKAKIAALTAILAKMAKEGDLLSIYMFEYAGKYLAKHIQAVYNEADTTLKCEKTGLRIVCIGSVWLSWDLMKNGFEKQLLDSRSIEKISLLSLTKPTAIGAAHLAARLINVKLDYPIEDNYTVFYSYTKNQN